MNTAKPSIPTNNGGAADDLIEELARLMAEGAQEKSADAPPPDGARLAVQSPRGKTSTIPFGASLPPRKSAPAADAPSRLTSAGQAADSPVHAPALKSPASSAREVASGSREPQPATPERFQDKRDQVSASSEPSAKKAGAGFSLRQSGGHQEKRLNQPASVRQNKDLDTGFGSVETGKPLEAKASVSADPIGDLIREHSNPDTVISDTVVKDDTGDDKSAGSDRRFVAPPRPASETSKADRVQKADKFPKTDRFRVPPVFGLDGKPSGPTSPVVPVKSGSHDAPVVASGDKSIGRSDALDEIENLIGNAVRVDFPEETSPEQDKDKQADTENPSAGRLAEPAPTSQKPPEDKVDSAEDAILQAMAAIGKTAHDQRSGEQSARPSNGDFVDVFADDDPQHSAAKSDDMVPGPERAGHGKTADKRISRLFVPLGAGIVLIAAILGGYWVLSSGGNNGEAPVLVADNTPSKQAPPKGQDSNSGQQTISSEIASNSGARPNERLVSRDQSGDLIGNTIRRITTTDNNQSGLANRRVRTVTVRPDGTIISGDKAVAGGQVLPVARPNVPKLPANALDPKLTNTVVAALPRTLTENDALTESDAAGRKEALRGDGAPRLSLTTRVNFAATPGEVAPIPRPRPANRAALVAQASSTPATATNNSGALDLIAGTSSPSLVQQPSATPAPAPIASSSVSNPKAWVQMASRRSQDAANQSAASLQTKYASVFGSRKLEVQRIDLGDRGVFFRVLLPAASLNDASSVCSAIKTAGGDCFTRNK